jgi:hypothetical protein
MTRTGVIRSVVPNPRHSKRFEVCLSGHASDERQWIPLYTLDPYAASLCERAAALHKAVMMQTRRTDFGELIDAVDFIPEPVV